MKNLKCVIEARMGSKRLPGKSMSQITPKFKLIDFVIGNALQSTYINKKNIFFLTSKNKNNKVLISHVKKNYGIKIFKGSEKNVYSRYKKFNDGKSYNILRLTADNPLIDPKLIDRFVECFTKSKAEYLTTRAMCHSKNWKAKSDFPKGISLEIFYSKKLFINDKRFNLLNQDSPTWFFFNKKFDVKVEKFKSFSFYKKPKKNSSFTIDTPKDLLRIKKFLKKNQCLPGKNNYFNYCRKF
jgi:spore coat polysaccharide biosynthesis protein SpsF (cytidylyltransferase family)